MEDVTTRLPLLPLTSGVVTPGMVVTLAADGDDGRAAIQAARHDRNRILLVPKVDGRYASVGTIAQIEQADGTAVLVRGIARGVLGAAAPPPDGTDGPALWVGVERVDDPAGADVPEDVRALALEYRATLIEILQRRRAGRIAESVAELDEPGQLADLTVYSPELPLERKVEVLETVDVRERLEKVLAWARDTLAELSVRERISNETAERLDKRQREAILRQQMAAIKAELGEDDGDVVEEYRTKVAGLASAGKLPEPVRTAAEKEIDRLERMGEQNPEHGWVRTWLDTLLELPWGVRTDDNLDLHAARATLDADHTGLNDVKDRIVEFLAVRKLRAERAALADEPASRRGNGAILALVGPPGVGKTSLGESVARTLGREFVRVALGGIRDEAEIRGHRRTYVGAQPGRIVRALKEAGSMNPVFLLDEVDKVASDWRGDPSAALLEVLDPAQNHTFRDHYLEVDLDLSGVLFLATANVLDTIPAPLLDRMEVIRLDGYSDDEKVAIATRHLVPRQIGGAALTPEEVTITDDAVAAVVAGYTSEAGVRSLERRLGTLVRKVATKVATGEVAPPLTIGPDAVREHLGRPTVHHEAAERTAAPGVATGLAVTGMGGDVLFIEALAMDAMDGEAGLTLTGQLGDVMKESASIALSYVRSTEPGAFDGKRVHLHVPAGAIPKDGPSAGITMVTALSSLLTGRPVKPGVGMTGEVTLQGRVLPIGGVKQKVLAAHRAGLREVVLPLRNEEDVDDVPQHVRDEVTFHFASDVREVLCWALEAA